MIPVILLAFRYQKSIFILIVLLGLCCTVTSVLLWQQNYTVSHYGHRDADSYGMYAKKLADYASDPQQREAIHKWFISYRQAHTALASVIIAVPIFFGADRDTTYLIFISLCGFIGLFLFHRILSERLRLSYRTILVAVIFFGCHLLNLRSFSRAVTDGLGLVLTLWTLDLLLARLETVKTGDTVSLAILMFLHPLARPQGFMYYPIILAGVLFCDWWRDRQFNFKDMVLAVTKIVFVPAVTIFLLYLVFGWIHNYKMMINTAKIFQSSSTFTFFVFSMVGLCQLLPLSWLFVKRQRLAHPSIIILLAFSLCYLSMLIVVKAPFWLRHFLPILPVVVCFGALGLEDIQRQIRKKVAIAIALALSSANVIVIVYQILATEPLSKPFKFIVSSG